MNWKTCKELEEWKEALKDLEDNKFKFHEMDDCAGLNTCLYRYNNSRVSADDLINKRKNMLLQSMVYACKYRDNLLLADMKNYMYGMIEKLTEEVKEQYGTLEKKEEPPIRTLQEAIDAINNYRVHNASDVAWRLYEFIPVDMHEAITAPSLQFKHSWPYKIEWVRSEILKKLEKIVSVTGIEESVKLLSMCSSFNYWTARFWLWVLNDDEFVNDVYTDYGLPFFKAVAEKYGFPVPEGL